MATPNPSAASLSEKRAEAEDYLDWFRHQANPRTLAEANVIADALATLLEEVLGGDDANAANVSQSDVISAAMDVWEVYDGLCKDANDGTFALWSEEDLQAALVNLGRALGHVGT